MLLGSGASSSANQLCYLGQVSAPLWALVPHLGGERAGVTGSHAALMSLPLVLSDSTPGSSWFKQATIPLCPTCSSQDSSVYERASLPQSMKEHPYLRSSQSFPARLHDLCCYLSPLSLCVWAGTACLLFGVAHVINNSDFCLLRALELTKA